MRAVAERRLEAEDVVSEWMMYAAWRWRRGRRGSRVHSKRGPRWRRKRRRRRRGFICE